MRKLIKKEFSDNVSEQVLCLGRRLKNSNKCKAVRLFTAFFCTVKENV